VWWLKPVFLATREVEMGRISSGKMFIRPHLDKCLSKMVQCYTRKAQIGRSRSRTAIKKILPQKLTKAKRLEMWLNW
jgi:hypothetical protein